MHCLAGVCEYKTVYFIVRLKHLGTYFLLRNGMVPGCCGKLSRDFGVDGERRYGPGDGKF